MPSSNAATIGGPIGTLVRTYFHLKPFLPHRLRWAMRRVRTPGILKRSQDAWPILESAGEAPADWSGWPDGKRFAFVLTHDVESADGVDKVRRLAELELETGFCSSFNFIPAGAYPDPVELRSWLLANGFEIGVHDLEHDGRLFESREGFRRKARKINRYLNDWGAVGFRSGFMLRRLEWLHELELLYDSSTFDTDPFEPQPEGTSTIFPFHIESTAGGYVELPYTLPQDSTLFLLLREQDSTIWKRKLDWIAEKGGLALVNIHPDYIDFSGGSPSRNRYPSRILRDFLDHVKDRYDVSYWNPLAKDLALWYASGSFPGDPSPPDHP